MFVFTLQKTDGIRDTMADFLYTYLQRRFGLDQMIIEWGYNLHDACHRYASDEHIGLFSGVLTEEVKISYLFFLHLNVFLIICPFVDIGIYFM